ncbi:MAG: hypothetical protein K6D55_10985 [Prevotella sp.]|nr:hypothetical protein [Prevotella sp.]
MERMMVHHGVEIVVAKLRKNERNAKENRDFLFICECQVSSAKPELRKNERNAKEYSDFLLHLSNFGDSAMPLANCYILHFLRTTNTFRVKNLEVSQKKTIFATNY